MELRELKKRQPELADAIDLQIALMELQRRDGVRDLVLQKHRSLAEGSKLSFRIVQQGIEVAN